MNTKPIREELARQDAQLAAAMKSLEEMGHAGFPIPEEALRALDAACEVRLAVSPKHVIHHPGIRG